MKDPVQIEVSSAYIETALLRFNCKFLKVTISSHKEIIWFNDNVTGSTHIMYANEFTQALLEEKLETSREKFREGEKHEAVA